MESAPVPAGVSVLEGSLAAAFADLAGPRRTDSVVYPLPAVLTLVVSALLAGQVSLGPRPQFPPTELDAVPVLMAGLDWRGRVLTGDGLFCQRTICQAVCEAGGDSLLPVKGNQPRLRVCMEAHFPDDLLREGQTAWTEETGHGRTHDRREVTVVPIADHRLAWPGLQQVYCYSVGAPLGRPSLCRPRREVTPQPREHDITEHSGTRGQRCTTTLPAC